MSPKGHDQRPVNRFPAHDSDVIVVIGSGAGGGTLANRLCQKGAKVVLIEAGQHHQPEDFINDEWASLNQLAWLDERTTSGSWRIAEEFPSLPAWTCKAVGGTTAHWAGCCPRFKDWEFRIRSEHGPIDGASLLDWPIGLSDLEPYYDKAEDRIGVTRTNGIPAPPAAWMINHDEASYQDIAAAFAGHPAGNLTRDEVLDNITFYWLTNTGISSARLYWENTFDFFGVKNVSIPAAVTVFPKEIYRAPRSWAERAYPKLIYFNEADRGCHFAAWQEPALFATEVRAAFRTLR
jgi:choline dehydrogenase-like flavoprotein